MRLAFLIPPALLLAACAGQSRPAEDDPWADYDPQPRNTYDETYKPPRTEPRPARGSADDYVRRAEAAIARARPDQARVEYQSAFGQDRWHVYANQGYQDLMLENELFDALWREYLDLWQLNTGRGDAFYFHLRPLMKRRGLGAVPLETRHEVSDETISQINTLLGDSTERAKAGDRDGALAAIDAAIKLADWPILHRVRIELLAPVEYEMVLAEYATRAEDNPQSGDALALHAKVVSYRDKNKALDLLRAGYVLELPGFWLPFGMAELCRDLGDQPWTGASLTPSTDFTRQQIGWYAAARDFFAICLATRPQDPDTLEGHGYATSRLAKLSGG